MSPAAYALLDALLLVVQVLATGVAFAAGVAWFVKSVNGE